MIRPLASPVVAFLLGGATSFGQTVLPHVVAPLANSAGSWCAVAFVLALWVHSPERRPTAAVVTAGLALVALVAGYYVVAHLRGFGVSTASVTFWVVAAVSVGPALGLGAAWLGGRSWRGAYAVLALPVLLAAEGVRSLLSIADTTGSAYWTGQIVVAVLLVPALAVFAVREAGKRSSGNT